jgi:hypothetical protein
MLWAIAVAGLAAGAGTFALAYTGREVADPAVHSTLIGWITLPFILSGVVGWSRRPDSRFGPLMIAAGFATFISTLSLASGDLLSTIGQTADLLPPVLFLHVFFAFPGGRLERRFEQVLVAAGYVVGFGFTLVVMTLGGYGSSNLLQIVTEPDAALAVQRVQLVAISALALAGIGVLAARRARRGSPAAPLPRAADRLLRAWTRDDRRPLHVAFLQRALAAAIALHKAGAGRAAVAAAGVSAVFVMHVAPAAIGLVALFLAGILRQRRTGAAVAVPTV